MKSPLRPGLLVGALAAVLVALTGSAVYSLVGLGSEALAITVAVAGAAAVLVIGVAWLLAREAEQQLEEVVVPLPAAEPAPAVVPPGKRGVQLREARPGEVPEAYLAAVRRGAQARQAAWKANARE
jgi:hypothetical protein